MGRKLSLKHASSIVKGSFFVRLSAVLRLPPPPSGGPGLQRGERGARSGGQHWPEATARRAARSGVDG